VGWGGTGRAGCAPYGNAGNGEVERSIKHPRARSIAHHHKAASRTDRSPATNERPPWFPQWCGETCTIIAGGPSAKTIDFAAAREQAESRWFGVNDAHRLAPWCDCIYACDGRWWRANSGLPNFQGLKITQDVRALKDYPDLKRVRCKTGVHDMLFDRFGEIGWGGNGGFHAINLAIQFGARRIVLVGFDMNLQRGYHWFGRHHGMSNPTQPAWTSGAFAWMPRRRRFGRWALTW
jgi:hypothetical protein